MKAKNERFPSKGFKGLNNVDDPVSLGEGWLVQADNVDITSRDALVRCGGFERSTTNTELTGAYSTIDFKRLYLVDSGTLSKINDDLSAVELKTGLGSAPVRFLEINGQVFYTNGVDRGLIDNADVVDWGIAAPTPPQLAATTGALKAGTYQVVCTYTNARGLESSNSLVASITLADDSSIVISAIPTASGYTTSVYVTSCDGTVFFLLSDDASGSISYNCSQNDLGREIEYFLLDEPRGTLPALFNGRVFMGEAFPSLDVSVIWRSLPMQYHHFDLADGLAVPGKVLMVHATDAALVIGTDRAIFAYDGEKLTQLADYGVVPGFHATTYDKKVHFWTLRGLCRALPFINLTESTVSVPPGSSAGATVIERGGYRRYVVALVQGGTAFNPRS